MPRSSPRATTSASNGAEMSMRVAALTPFGVTPPSDPVLVNPSGSLPATPTSVRVVSSGSTTALLTWGNNASADGWSIYRALQPGGPYTQLRQGWQRTTYLDNAIPAGNSAAFYVVQAEALGQVGAYSDEIGARLDATVPSAPANLVATPGIGWVKLTWDPVAQASGYVVWGTNGSTSAPTQLGWVTNGTRFDHLSLTNGADYRYFVQAVVDALPGNLSTASATPIVAPSYQHRPVQLSVSSVRVNNVSLSYAVPPGSSVQVLRALNSGGPYTSVGTSGNDGTVAPTTTYFYVVRPDNGATQGELSNEVRVTTPTATPAVPTGLVASPADSTVALSWNPVSNASTYQVGTSSNPSGPFSLGNTSLDSHANQNVTNATLTYFAVRAGNGVDWSAWSPSIAATATSSGLATPVVYTTAGNGVVTVSWTAITGATQYRVFRKSPLLTDWVDVSPPTLTLGFNDTSVTNDTEYVYQVQALNPGAGTQSPWSSASAVARPSSTMAARALNFSITRIATGFLASWSPVPGATSYTVRSAFRAGGSFTAPQVSSGTNEAFETRCNLAGTPGTDYFISLAVVTPEGETASTDELGPLRPNPAAPALPGIQTYTGNERTQSTATVVPNTQYRFARRFRGRDWQVLNPGADPYFFEPQPNSVEVKYALQAINDGGVSGWSSSSFIAPSSQAPTLPTGVVITPVNGGAILAWEPVLGTTSMNLQSSTDLAGTGATSLGTNNDAEDTMRTVSLPGPRFVRFLPASSNIFSLPQAVTPTAAVPAAPSLTVQAGLQAADLDWTAVSGATAYRVHRRIAPGPWRLLITVPPGVTSMRDLSLENGETVSWAVQAVTSSGVTGWSATQNRTMNSNFPPVPMNMTLTPGDGAVTATWDVVPNATGYLVQISNNGGMSWGSASCSLGSPYENHCRVGVTNGATALVRMYASNATGTSLWTTPITTPVPSAGFPDTLPAPTVAANGPGSLRVSWFTSTDATSYRIYRRATNGVATQIMDVAGPPFDDTGLTSGTQYLYYVHGLNGMGAGAWSSPSTAATAP